MCSTICAGVIWPERKQAIRLSYGFIGYVLLLAISGGCIGHVLLLAINFNKAAAQGGKFVGLNFLLNQQAAQHQGNAFLRVHSVFTRVLST